MKEIPILYSSLMVNAILDDRKIMTRRVINRLHSFGIITELKKSDTPGYDWIFRDKRKRWNDISTERLFECCPYGKPGDLLWVRETFAPFIRGDGGDWYIPLIRYRADGSEIVVDESGEWSKLEKNGYHWRPSIHMHKKFCRIWLKVKNIRVERLQDISEEDARKEGIEQFTKDGVGFKYGLDGWNWSCQTGSPFMCNTAKIAFEMLWDSINGKPRKNGTDISWKANPWVWVVEFEKTDKPEATY